MATISSLSITIGTGDDDLRSDSTATAYIKVQTGDDLTEFSSMIKSENDPGWGNNTTNGPITWNLPAGITDQNLETFGIRMQSHPSGFETGDNWNMNTILVTYPDASGGQTQLVDAAGAPLFRFTGDQPEWSIQLT
jgi:carbohydrate-binding DOMON domain-containing protein